MFPFCYIKLNLQFKKIRKIRKIFFKCRLWSSWDLRLVREITSNVKGCGAIIAVAWALDQHHLYAVTEDSTVLIWEGSKRLSNGTPKFVNLTSF